MHADVCDHPDLPTSRSARSAPRPPRRPHSNPDVARRALSGFLAPCRLRHGRGRRHGHGKRLRPPPRTHSDARGRLRSPGSSELPVAREVCRRIGEPDDFRCGSARGVPASGTGFHGAVEQRRENPAQRSTARVRHFRRRASFAPGDRPWRSLRISPPPEKPAAPRKAPVRPPSNRAEGERCAGGLPSRGEVF